MCFSNHVNNSLFYVYNTHLTTENEEKRLNMYVNTIVSSSVTLYMNVSMKTNKINEDNSCILNIY